MLILGSLDDVTIIILNMNRNHTFCSVLRTISGENNHLHYLCRPAKNSICRSGKLQTPLSTRRIRRPFLNTPHP